MEVIQEKNWFQRNWLWAVPVGGCGCGCLVLILVFVFGIGATFFGISKIFYESTPVKYAKELAFKHPDIIENLGNNIEAYGIPSGNISLNNDDGKVDFSIPIKGELGKAVIIVRGIKTDGVWAYEDLYVVIKDKQLQINLLEKNLESI